MPLQVIRNNIADVKVDMIVCPCNRDPMSIGGAQKAIYDAAGAELFRARIEIGKMRTTEVQVTPAFHLKGRYVLHCCGPVYTDGKHGEEQQLRACYKNALAEAKKYYCRSIAFPLLSSGTYGYPKDEAIDIAREEILSYADIDELKVILVLFDRESYHISLERKQDVDSYINDRAVEDMMEEEYYARPSHSMPQMKNDFPHPSVSLPSPQAKKANYKREKPKENKLERILFRKKETFQTMLLRKIDEKGLTDTEVYKRANIDRKLFSKIRSNPDYHPKKETILALSFSMELSKDEAEDLLRRAGYALSPSSHRDLIVSYCFDREIYDLIEVNSLLYEYSQPMLP